MSEQTVGKLEHIINTLFVIVLCVLFIATTASQMYLYSKNKGGMEYERPDEGASNISNR